MPSVFDIAFASQTAPELMESFAAAAVYTPAGGTGRPIVAVVQSSPEGPEPAPDGLGWVERGTALIFADDGRGAAAPREGDRLTVDGTDWAVTGPAGRASGGLVAVALARTVEVERGRSGARIRRY